MVKVIETTEEGREVRFFQCNVPSEVWTDEIHSAILDKVAEITGREKEGLKIHLGSGFFRPGMNEIFFVV